MKVLVNQWNFQSLEGFFLVMGQSKWLIAPQKKRHTVEAHTHTPLIEVINKCPLFIIGVLAQVENGYKQFWKEKFHATNEKAQQHALRGGGTSLIFPMCSLEMFPITPQFQLMLFNHNLIYELVK